MMERSVFGTLILSLLMLNSSAQAQLAPGSLDVQWNEGASDCAAGVPGQPVIQIHQYNANTYILRQNLCATFEAPFIYLLLGSSRALLIDTGAVEDPQKMPLADTVMGLLPAVGQAKLPLLVLHTHRHMDHRAGDPQFANRPGVQVVPAFLEDVQKHFGFKSWPQDRAEIDLGDRTVDVIPTPGHNATHLSFYDRSTGLFFTGDFLLPGRFLVEDIDTYIQSASRAAEFAKTHPIAHVLGAHIEMNRAEELFPWQSTHHPDERDLPLTKADVLALPDILRSFNGVYTTNGKWVMIHPERQLMVLGAGALLVLVVLVLLARWYFRRRKAARLQRTALGSGG